VFSASLPFDYVKHLDRFNPARRTRRRPTATRVRRPTRKEDVSA
jgi:hypothetical protein